MKNFIDLKLMTDKIIQASACDHGLDIVYAFKKIILPAAVQLGKHIIQKQYRFVVNDLLHQINLRKLQGKRSRPLLPL